MFRREWRQQILVVALLAVAVAAAIGSITIVSNTAPTSANDPEFGSADSLLELDGTDPQKLERSLAAAEVSFGTTDVVWHRSVNLPGGVERVDFRAQDPEGPYGGELLALRQGDYPTGPREVAVTDGVAKLLRLEVGSALALDGLRRTVVGIVENPTETERRVRSRLPLAFESSGLRHRHGQRTRGSDGLLHGVRGRRARGLRVRKAPGERPAARYDVRDVLGGHRIPPPRLAGCLGGFRGRGAATAPPARHARRHRRHAEAPPSRPPDARRCRRRDRSVDRGARGHRALVPRRSDFGARDRSSHRPARPSVGADHGGRAPRGPRGNRRCLVARADGHPSSRNARTLRAAPQAEARTPLGHRGGSADRSRHRLSRAVGPRQRAAHRLRDHGDDRRLPAPGSPGDSDLLPRRRASLDRATPGVARPGAVSGPFRGRARGNHAGSRHRSDDRRHCVCRGGEGSRGAAQLVRSADPGVPGSGRRS